MTNKPMIDNPSDSILSAFAGSRVAGKPFTISEYSPNPNNLHSHSNYPIVAAYAALHDIDGVFVFNYFRGYQDYRDFLIPGGGVYPDSLTGFYNIAGDTRAESLMHLAANLYRRGDVAAESDAIYVQINDQLARDQLLSGAGASQINEWLEDSVIDANETAFDVRMGARQP